MRYGAKLNANLVGIAFVPSPSHVPASMNTKPRPRSLFQATLDSRLGMFRSCAEIIRARVAADRMICTSLVKFQIGHAGTLQNTKTHHTHLYVYHLHRYPGQGKPPRPVGKAEHTYQACKPKAHEFLVETRDNTTVVVYLSASIILLLDLPLIPPHLYQPEFSHQLGG
ncbi:hypothetical protein LX36DRAFT_650029 [Colletotrichum falcatum]|nr:hypothetical protein LX36DRAFT_650029 [Colletotrichum falcatum]